MKYLQNFLNFWGLNNEIKYLTNDIFYFMCLLNISLQIKNNFKSIMNRPVSQIRCGNRIIQQK